MNIRKSTHNTYIEGYWKDLEIKVPTYFGYRTHKHRLWVDSKNEEKTTLEFLDPTDATWKPIPEKSTRTYISTKNEPRLSA